ncbi:MAG: hypothetical protein ABH848_03305, partial [Candidatus Omnitrophota bacterium]
RRGEAINQLIIQNKNIPISMEEQIIYLVALDRGKLDNLSVEQIKQFRKDIRQFIENSNPGFFEKLRTRRDLTEDALRGLEEALEEYFKDVLKK